MLLRGGLSRSTQRAAEGGNRAGSFEVIVIRFMPDDRQHLLPSCALLARESLSWCICGLFLDRADVSSSIPRVKHEPHFLLASRGERERKTQIINLKKHSVYNYLRDVCLFSCGVMQMAEIKVLVLTQSQILLQIPPGKTPGISVHCAITLSAIVGSWVDYFNLNFFASNRHILVTFGIHSRF